MNTKQNDVVTEYLHEVDLRLSGLPVLQRRELLADLAAHVATERTERNIQTEGELIEILERLGSPEVVAAAAYEEAGSYSPVPTARRRQRPKWLIPVVVGVVLLMLVLCGSAVFARSSRVDEPATQIRVPAAPAAPAEVVPAVPRR
jgi:uncharacterized membrane protein